MGAEAWALPLEKRPTIANAAVNRTEKRLLVARWHSVELREFIVAIPQRGSGFLELHLT
jgi:hypothetical protein